MECEASSSKPMFLILNSKLEELIELKAQAHSWPKPWVFYLSAMISYLKIDTISLEADFKNIEKAIKEIKFTESSKYYLEDYSIVKLFIEARLQIRKLNFNDQIMSQLNKINLTEDLLIGERAFVQALFFGQCNDYQLEQEYYEKSYVHFKKAGAMAKALLSLQNAIASEASIYPDRRFTIEYNHLLQQAIHYKLFSTAGLCALNISREYQLIGAHLMALKMANKSLEYLQEDFGTQQYGLALCHRAQLLVEMSRTEEAQLDLDGSTLVETPEVSNARSYVLNLMQGNTIQVIGRNSSAWIDRKSKLSLPLSYSFGRAEESLLVALSQKPMDKNEILEILFEDEISKLDYEVVINRFKNLLSRVRKKAPELIVFDGNKYSLSNTSMQFMTLLREPWSV